MKKHPPQTLCPCGSNKNYTQCCARWHSGELYLQAPDATALMRSRYSAFVLNLAPYLLATWHPSTRPQSIEPSEVGLKWLGLEIKDTQQVDETHATVEFVARYRIQGQAHRMHERSQFEKIKDQWLYLGAESETIL